ncbi:unnamed protein product [Adineta ricciae]|uniref:Uncharacterized protein n=1 Tax=Adineta ricciae TaxID=249248 RepID=A0A815C1Q4_ADIRI|nr:unnamed protein product [Adineta ricciae]CAF1602591.1 unnamed protein product [Adineta ricciae]
MASSPPSSVKSEPTGGLYSAHEPNLSYASAYDTSLEHTLPHATDDEPAASSSIFIDAPVLPSNDAPFELLQGFSAPTLPVYINMGMNDTADNVTFAGPITTTDPPLSRSLAAIDVDHPAPSTTAARHSHHHHHFPHHSQARNRYPYLQRQSSKGLHRTSESRSSLEGLPYYEQRPAFRRSYFALRRQRIPKAPPMPKHLFPGYRQSRTMSPANETDDNENEDEDDDEGNLLSSCLLFDFNR